MSELTVEMPVPNLVDNRGAAVAKSEKEQIKALIRNTLVVPKADNDPAHILAEAEKVIEKGLGSFVEVGEALSKINEGRLYKKKEDDSFENYCATRWGMQDKHAYRLIDAAKCFRTLEKALTTKDKRLPGNEAQIRPLIPLEEKLQVRAWEHVLADNKESKITAAEVEKVVESLASKDKKRKKTTEKASKGKKTNGPEQQLTKIAKLAKKGLDEISDLSAKSLKSLLGEILALTKQGK